MSMRALKRNIARNRMKAAGIDRINRRRVWDGNAAPKKKGDPPGAFRSYFAMNWRKYLDPETPQYKYAMSQISRKRRLMRNPYTV